VYDGEQCTAGPFKPCKREVFICVIWNGFNLNSVGVSSFLNHNHEVERKSSVQMKRKRRLSFNVSWRDLVMDVCWGG
jgi:hypothetical protein